MRYGGRALSYAVLGLVFAAGVVYLGLYAAGDDSYYYPTAVSRWDHASHWGAGATALVVAGLVLASAAALACLARGFLPRRFAVALPVVPTIAAYCVALVMAWYPLTGGH
jgi:hypothetical protein